MQIQMFKGSGNQDWLITGSSWPLSSEEPPTRGGCFHAVCAPHNVPQPTSNFQRLINFMRIVDFNPEVPDSAFELGVAKEKR